MTKLPKLTEDELWDKPLSERIRYLRERHAPSQEAFARLIGTTRETVNRWESGTEPQRRFAEALAKLEDHPVGLYAAESDFQWVARQLAEVNERLAKMDNRIDGQLGQQEAPPWTTDSDGLADRGGSDAARSLGRTSRSSR